MPENDPVAVRAERPIRVLPGGIGKGLRVLVRAGLLCRLRNFGSDQESPRPPRWSSPRASR
ncbi:MAG TPA: hypothetical protein VFA63_05460 [Pseudonocardiaceae bacterium]|nr:hypothetical protein [Pseudonocardiaceae bacterium]